MTREKEQALIALTEQCLTEYWQKNAAFVLQYCAPDVTWIGAEQKQYMQGVEAVTEDFRQVEAVLQPCALANGEFWAVQNSGSACTVVGRYLVQTTPEAEYFLCAEQRCTFVWEVSPAGPLLRHMHVSNPIGEMKVAQGSRFVNEVGRMARRYVEEHLADLEGSRVTVEDLNGVLHVLQARDVLYVAADLRYSAITCREGKVIHAKLSIAQFEKLADAHFVRVHRSYIVNLCYVSVIRPYEIVMSDGAAIPVPEKKFAAVKKQLQQRFEG